MYGEFKTHDLGNGYSLVEPPAGLLPYINKRIKQYNGEDQLTQAIYSSIFVLACLHEGSVPSIATLANKLAINTAGGTIRAFYKDTTEEEFAQLIEEFLFSIPRDQLKDWFDAVDEQSLITKKTTDAEKKD